MTSAAGGVALGLGLVACGSNTDTHEASNTEVENAIQASCTATTRPGCPASTPHYADVVPILQKSCIPCHPGPPGATQWPLTAYSDISPWADVIQDELCRNAMPPADGGVAINESDRLALLNWVQCGAPK